MVVVPLLIGPGGVAAGVGPKPGLAVLGDPRGHAVQVDQALVTRDSVVGWYLSCGWWQEVT